MDEHEACERLQKTLRQLVEYDRHRLENDPSNRCIASRLAMYLQQLFPNRAEALNTVVTATYPKTGPS
jgi:hypothetical protein